MTPTLLQIVEDASIGHRNDNPLRVNFKNKMIIMQTNEKQGREVLSSIFMKKPHDTRHRKSFSCTRANSGQR